MWVGRCSCSRGVMKSGVPFGGPQWAQVFEDLEVSRRRDPFYAPQYVITGVTGTP